jgi:hypothetical protein
MRYKYKLPELLTPLKYPTIESIIRHHNLKRPRPAVNNVNEGRIQDAMAHRELYDIFASLFALKRREGDRMGLGCEDVNKLFRCQRIRIAWVARKRIQNVGIVEEKKKTLDGGMIA